LTLANVPENLHAPEDLTDYNDHGTGMAAATAGTRHGIANTANLYLIKVVNAKRSNNNQWLSGSLTPEAMDDALSHIVEIVHDRGLQGKAVVTMSSCK
jgi:hypothetical protein